MLFTEPTFLFVFLPLVLGTYFVVGSGPRNAVLLVASVIFYARGAGPFTWLVLGSIGFTYLAALAIASFRGTRRGRRVLIGTVAINLAVLAVFKYAGFAVGNLNVLMEATGAGPLPVPDVLLPIGISFFTFHAISYVVDVYRGDASAQKRPIEAALYLLVFPQLIAGPIIRYRQIAEQLPSRVNTTSDFAYGVGRFVIGLSKKLLIANTLAGPADHIFGMAPAEITAAHAWIAVSCYTLQISWVFFRADTLTGAVAMLGAMFGQGGTVPAVYAPAWYLNPELLLALTAGAIGSTPVVPRVAEWLSNPDAETGERRMPWPASLAGVVALIGLLTASMALSSAQTYHPFIYFRF